MKIGEITLPIEPDLIRELKSADTANLAMVLAAGRDSESGRCRTDDEYSGRTLSEQSQASFFAVG